MMESLPILYPSVSITKEETPEHPLPIENEQRFNSNDEDTHIIECKDMKDQPFPIDESTKFLLSFGPRPTYPSSTHLNPPTHPLYTSSPYRSSSNSPTQLSPYNHTHDVPTHNEETSLMPSLSLSENTDIPIKVSYFPYKSMSQIVHTSDSLEKTNTHSSNHTKPMFNTRSKSTEESNTPKKTQSSSIIVNTLRSFLDLASNITDKSTHILSAPQSKKKNDHPKKGQSVSYAQLLVPSKYEYNAYVFNNPRFKQGKHQTVMTMNNYSLSIIPYVKSKKLKDEINELFRLQNPWLPETMTLSKIRNLKADLFSLLDHFKFIKLPTVASGWVYFERLVMKKVVTKTNRKLYAIACFILSYKFNQLLFEEMPTELLSFIPRFDRRENLTAADIFRVEFEVFILLDFSLKLEYSDIMPHIRQYLENKDLNFEDVFGMTEQTFHSSQMPI